MQLTELKERDRNNESSRVDARWLSGRVDDAIKATGYHEPGFQIVFQLRCERKLRTAPDEALPWALSAPRFIEFWKRRAPTEAAVWARFLVRAHAVRATAERVAGNIDAANDAYLRAISTLDAYRTHVPASDVCDLYRRYGGFWALKWRLKPALILLNYAMEVANRTHECDAEPDLQDVARSHAMLGAVYTQFGLPAGEAVQILSPAAQRAHRLQASYHLGCAVRQLDVNVNRFLADASLVNLVTISTFNREPTERRAILAQIDKARLQIRERTGNVSQFACRLDWLQGLVHHSLGEHEQAAKLLRETRNRFIRKKADLLYLIITLDLAEIERARGNWADIRRMAKRLEPVIERRAGKDGPVIDHIRAWREAVLAREVDDKMPWPALDKLRSCLFNLPGVPSSELSTPQLPSAEPA
ncbi:MAG: hypothetical protein AAF772_04100 [Acidobacteriota bacterium]